MKDLQLQRIPSLPSTIVEILQGEKRGSYFSPRDLAEIVVTDPGLTAETLRIANSSYYGVSGKVKTVSQAINILGVNTVRRLAVKSSLYDILWKVQREGVASEYFRYLIRMTLVTGVSAKTLCKVFGCGNQEFFMIVGLLRRIGQILLLINDPDHYPQDVGMGEEELLEKERSLYGTDYLQVGAWVAREWHFPEEFVNSFAPVSGGEEEKNLAYVVSLADQFAQSLLVSETKRQGELKCSLEKSIQDHFHIRIYDHRSFLQEFVEDLQREVEDKGRLQAEMLDVLKLTEASQKTLYHESEALERDKQVILALKDRISAEKRYITENLKLSESLSWLGNPDELVTRLLTNVGNGLNPERVFLLFCVDKEFYRYTLQEQVLFKEEATLKESGLAGKAFQNREVQLERTAAGVGIFLPVACRNKVWGVLCVRLGRTVLYTPEMLKYLETAVQITGNALQNYETFQENLKEREKKSRVVRELFNTHIDKAQCQELLEEVQKHRNQSYVLRSIFHKINNKMTPIMGYSQMMMMSLQGKEKERAEKIYTNAEKAVKIMDSILDYISSGEGNLEAVNINREVETVLSLLEYKLDATGIHVTCELDPSIPEASLNRLQVEDVFIHIIVNAIEALKLSQLPTKNFLVKTGFADGLFQVSMKDNGIGIPEEDLPLVFEPFFGRFEGRKGLGLNYVHSFVTAHEGKIGVESRKGEGTELHFTFAAPLITKPHPAKPIEEAPVKGEARILVVDDEEALVELMVEVLSYERGFKVFGVHNGRQAIEELGKNDYDLIISDITMPDVSGIELYRVAKEKHPGTQVILVSGNPYSDEIKAFLKENRIPLLSKPFALMELTEFVKKNLNGGKSTLDIGKGGNI